MGRSGFALRTVFIGETPEGNSLVLYEQEDLRYKTREERNLDIADFGPHFELELKNQHGDDLATYALGIGTEITVMEDSERGVHLKVEGPIWSGTAKGYTPREGI